MNGGGKSSLFKALALAENVPVDGDLQIDGKVGIFVPAKAPFYPSFFLPSFLPSFFPSSR
jgi:ABC-type polysaccharide/polyol phosphate transport system ATPase subunit